MDSSPAMLAAAHQDGPPVGFGLVGAGSLAQRCLAPAIHAARGARLQAVAARDEQRAAALEPQGRAYSDYRSLLADDDVEVVYVALNNAGHLPWTLAALEAGKHVLCEKPLGLSQADVVAMTDAARAADRLLVEAFWYRWHPRTLRLQHLLTSGSFGEVLGVNAEFSFDGPAEADPATAYRHDPAGGGGALFDVGCYALSVAHLALGSDLEVRGVTTLWSPSGVDLHTVVMLASPGPEDGGSGRGHAMVAGGISGTDQQHVQVDGSSATAIFGPPAFTSLFTPCELRITDEEGNLFTESFEGTDPYRLMVESLAARVRGQDAFLVDLEHSRQIARTTEAAFAALREDGPAPRLDP